jgi:hypothetical protein
MIEEATLRVLGTDPERWARAFLDAAEVVRYGSSEERIAFVTRWFDEAMEAAIREVT